MNIKGKKVLVTGAGGFIGSHLTEQLVKEGCEVSAFVRYTANNDWGNLEYTTVRDRVEIISGNLRDPEIVRNAVSDCDVVFHLGAMISIPYSYVNPREAVECNVIGTFNVLNAVRELGIKKMIHTSTSEVYGTAQQVPISEEHPLNAQSPYSASKIGADKLAESFFKTYKTPVTTIRPFNTFGPRQSARAVIPTIITQCLKNEKIYLGDTRPTRDFLFVTDTANGFIKAANCDKANGETINLGTGKEVSIKEVAEKIKELSDSKSKITFDEKRVRPETSEVMRLCADNSKAKSMLKWEPKMTLEAGLKQCITWCSEHSQFYKPDRYNI